MAIFLEFPRPKRYYQFHQILEDKSEIPACLLEPRLIQDAFPLPDPKMLTIGDRIRILRVPDWDLQQREVEVATGVESPGWTADSIERIIAQTPVVRVSRVDEYGSVWYEAKIIGPDGTEEYHELNIYSDDTWEIVDGMNG